MDFLSEFENIKIPIRNWLKRHQLNVYRADLKMYKDQILYFQERVKDLEELITIEEKIEMLKQSPKPNIKNNLT